MRTYKVRIAVAGREFYEIVLQASDDVQAGELAKLHFFNSFHVLDVK
jgi:hypothetical protein